MKIIVHLLALHVIMANSLLDFELIFSLGEYFSSDVILLATKEGEVELAKKFFKFKSSYPRTFLGVIDLDKNSDEEIPLSQISAFQNIMIVSDCEEDFIKKLLQLQDELSHLMASLVIIIFEQEDSTAKLENFYIPFSYKFLLIKNREILDVYQIGVNGSKIYSHFSTWDNAQLKFETSIENFYSRRMDLRGHVINVMFVPDHGYTEYFELFSDIMNFSINYALNLTYGGIFENGTKTGIFKQLDHHLLDGTNHNFKFSLERAKYFDYIFPAQISETIMYVALNQDINWSSFIAPFSFGLWISAVTWIIVASITMHFINKFSCGNNPDSSFFNVLKAFFSQGGEISNTNTSFYIAYFTSYILGLVMVQAYSGVFLSHLTIKKLTPPFENLKGSINVGTHKILLENYSYTSFFFNSDDGEEATYIRNNLLLPEREFVEFEDKEAGFYEVCRRKIVYITQATDYTIKGDCDIKNLKEILFKDVEGIIVWRGFPYKDIMNDLMKKIQFSGLMKLRRKNKIVPYDSSKIFASLSFNSVLSIFLVLIFLMIFSVAVLICEILFHRHIAINNYD